MIFEKKKKRYARERKYARYGKTSHRKDKPLYTSSGIFFSIPENTKTFKDSIKIDQVRPKTEKTRFVRASTQEACTAQNIEFH